MIIIIQQIKSSTVAFDHGQHLPAVQIILRPLHKPNNLAQLPDSAFIHSIALQNIFLQYTVGPFAEFDTSL